MKYQEKTGGKNKKKFVLNTKILDKNDFSFITNLKKKFPFAEIFLVGGAVRDLFLSRKTKDYDFVVRNVKINDLEKFLSKQGEVNLVGQIFGVFKFTPKNGDRHNPFDIALPRQDFSLKTGGYRDVEIQTNPRLKIEKDLSRRDFTINAMALKWGNKNKKGEHKWQLIDPYQGLKDLKQKIIRAVGRPEDRFSEDYSRMLRAIRLSCQLNFKIEEDTWRALKKKMEFIGGIDRKAETIYFERIAESTLIEKRIVPYEVIAKEFIRTFSYNPVKAFDLYDQSDAFNELMPELLKMKGCPQPKNYHSEGDVWQHTRLALKNLKSTGFKKFFGKEAVSNEVIIATLFHDIGKPYTIQTPEKDKTDRIRFNEHDTVGAEKTKKILQKLKFSSPDKVGININETAWLVEQHMILIRGDISKMRNRTIEKYFFNPDLSGTKLLQVSFADISATITEHGPVSFDKFNQMVKRINDLKKLSETRKELPKPIITGIDIMQEFNLPPGPRVGKFLEMVREKQLNGKIKTKEAAIKFLKNRVSKKH
jgi:poly(A) polymerase